MTDGKIIKKSELWDEFYTALHVAYDSMRSAFKMRSLEGLTQDDIVSRLQSDKALISKRLNGQENLTLKTLSFMASAMDCRLEIKFVPYEELGQISYVQDYGAVGSFMSERNVVVIANTVSSTPIDIDLPMHAVQAA